MDTEEIEGVKFSEFPSATPGDSDEVVGLHAGDNARFSVANFVLAIRQGLANIFVPLTRTINGKALSTDITLDASDVGAVDTADVGVADGVASLDSNGKVPGTQLDLSGKQDTITANGILKGDGQGGVSAATAGTDYQAPLTIDATPTASSTNPVQSGGVYTDVRTRVSVYGMGKNLLDNAYFVGGGSQLGDGIFPINQRGQAQYTLSSGVYTLDRWRAYKYSGSATVNLTVDGLEFSGQDCAFSQKVKVNPAELLGKPVTLSALIDGNLLSKTEVMPSSFSQSSTVINIQGTGINVTLVSRPAPVGWTNAYYVSLGTASTTVKVIKAAKLEFGTEQTLAHQENGVWVLNEIPDYGEELRKCQRYYFDTGGGMVITGLCNSAGTEVNLFCPTPVSMNSENFTATASIGWLRGEGTGWTSGYTFTTNYIRILKNGVDGMGVSKSGLSGQSMYGAYFTKLVFTAEP